ncbi:sugar transferase [Collinsella stercoris]|uniref:sugar transferase n=1 Tax=Collinsella stercoris TaxID=147206 RepID=UPI001D1399EB|nr:sugar transferase [Collinsella stercoris]UEA45364.1 sugar transferase [Collinsella stercoris DSM 13279]UWP12111.1 sugar transferase [Collinsella stercoris]
MSSECMDEMQSGASGAGTVPEDGMAAGREDGVVAAPVHTPVAGTRSAAEDGERSVRRLSLMRSAEAYDRERLGYRVAKRAFDIAFSAAVIAVGLVPGAILCAAIAIDSPGCPLYGQRRVGRMGADGRPREFTMWKFRSMVKDADKMKDALLAENEVEGPMFKMRDDPRVTRIGRFIRRHSIDEFPQFVNVLLGDMSVVGPRPPLPREVEQYDEWAMQRLAVKPGLTGPWQVGGRSDVDFDDMVRLDLGYIARRSVSMDLKIILQTIAVVFTGKGAA